MGVTVGEAVGEAVGVSEGVGVVACRVGVDDEVGTACVRTSELQAAKILESIIQQIIHFIVRILKSSLAKAVNYLIILSVTACKLHQTAFDSSIICVTPDNVIHIREDVRSEDDGPILRHGLQGIEGRR